MVSFCAIYRLKSLIKESNFHKNSDNPICIDLILSNSPRINVRDWFIRLLQDDSDCIEIRIST